MPAGAWLEEMRADKTADEVERIAAACAVADRALAALLPEIRPGVTEHDLALRLEWLIRTGGAEALAFDVACLAGSRGRAARTARRATARCSTGTCCCSTSAPRWRATGAT